MCGRFCNSAEREFGRSRNRGWLWCGTQGSVSLARRSAATSPARFLRSVCRRYSVRICRIGCAICLLLGFLWLIPDRRIERVVRRPWSRLKTWQLPSDREKFSVERGCMRTTTTSSFAAVSTRLLGRWRHETGVATAGAAGSGGGHTGYPESQNRTEADGGYDNPPNPGRKTVHCGVSPPDEPGDRVLILFVILCRQISALQRRRSRVERGATAKRCQQKPEALRFRNRRNGNGGRQAAGGVHLGGYILESAWPRAGDRRQTAADLIDADRIGSAIALETRAGNVEAGGGV